MPKARKQKLQAGGEQKAHDLGGEQAAAGQTYGVARIVDEIRQHLATWALTQKDH